MRGFPRADETPNQCDATNITCVKHSTLNPTHDSNSQCCIHTCTCDLGRSGLHLFAASTHNCNQREAPPARYQPAEQNRTAALAQSRFQDAQRSASPAFAQQEAAVHPERGKRCV